MEDTSKLKAVADKPADDTTQKINVRVDDPEAKPEEDTAPEGSKPVSDELTISEEPDNTSVEIEASQPNEVVPTDHQEASQPETGETHETLALEAPEEVPQIPAVVSSESFFSRYKKWVFGGVAAALLIAAAGGAYALTRPEQKPVATTPKTTKTSQKKVAELGVAATLTEGTVEYSTDAKTWAALTDKTSLKTGNEVRTGANGRVVLTLDDGSAVRLGNSASIKLTSLAVDDVVIENLTGEVYSRVMPSTTRTYTVSIDGNDMVAKGTAFRTMSSDQKKGVEVYQSTVAVSETDVTEGKAYFLANTDATKEDKVSDIDLNALKNDAFVKWNAGLDKQMTEAKDKLGVLVDIDKPAATPTPTATPTPAQSNGIVLSGSLAGYTGKFSWSVTGVDVSKGFKLVRSTSTQQPTYPGSEAQYVDTNARSTTWEMGGGKTYYVRICAYRDGSCDSYSNTVTLTTPAKTSDSGGLVNGTVSANLSGTTLSWTITGTAPKGYKVVYSLNPDPVYPNRAGDNYLYISDPADMSASMSELSSMQSGKNYIRVCKYTGGGCTDYSGTVTYTK